MFGNVWEPFGRVLEEFWEYFWKMFGQFSGGILEYVQEFSGVFSGKNPEIVRIFFIFSDLFGNCLDEFWRSLGSIVGKLSDNFPDDFI